MATHCHHFPSGHPRSVSSTATMLRATAQGPRAFNISFIDPVSSISGLGIPSSGITESLNVKGAFVRRQSPQWNNGSVSGSPLITSSRFATSTSEAPSFRRDHSENKDATYPPVRTPRGHLVCPHLGTYSSPLNTRIDHLGTPRQDDPSSLPAPSSRLISSATLNIMASNSSCSPLARPTRSPPPDKMPELRYETTPTQYLFSVVIPGSARGLTRDMICISMHRRDRLLISVDLWHEERDGDLFFSLSFFSVND